MYKFINEDGEVYNVDLDNMVVKSRSYSEEVIEEIVPYEEMSEEAVKCLTRTANCYEGMPYKEAEREADLMFFTYQNTGEDEGFFIPFGYGGVLVWNINGIASTDVFEVKEEER